MLYLTVACWFVFLFLSSSFSYFFCDHSIHILILRLNINFLFVIFTIFVCSLLAHFEVAQWWNKSLEISTILVFYASLIVERGCFWQVLLFSTMTRLLDVMEDYLVWKQYRYLRLDGHTSGGDRGGLIEQFNNPDSPYFIFLLRYMQLNN